MHNRNFLCGIRREESMVRKSLLCNMIKICISVPLFILKTLHLPDWTFVLHKDLALLSARTLNLSWGALLKEMLLNERNNGPINLRQRSVLYYAYNLKYVLEKSLKQVHQTIFISKAAFLVFLITRQTHSYESVNKNKTTYLHLAFGRRKHY